jgi:hypothetical protein
MKRLKHYLRLVVRRDEGPNRGVEPDLLKTIQEIGSYAEARTRGCPTGSLYPVPYRNK